jgi:hypothetical protein
VRPDDEPQDEYVTRTKRRTDPLGLREKQAMPRRPTFWYYLRRWSGSKCGSPQLEAVSTWLVMNVVMRLRIKLAGTFLESELGLIKIGVYEEEAALAIGAELRNAIIENEKYMMEKVPGRDISCKLSLRSGVPGKMPAADLMKTVLILNQLKGTASGIEKYEGNSGFTNKLKFIPDAEMLADLKERMAKGEYNLHIAATVARIRLDDPEARMAAAAAKAAKGDQQ